MAAQRKLALALQPIMTALRRDIFVLAWFGLLSLAMMYAVAPAPQRLIIGWPGDNIQYVYMTGRVAQALARFESPFTDPLLNYPDGLLLPATDAPFLSLILAAPLTWLTNPTFSYNLILYLSCLFSGYFTYLWARRLTGNRLGGLVAGSVFILFPYRSAQSYGHMQMISTQFIPVFFFVLDRALGRDRPSFTAALTMAGVAFLLGASSQYLLVICLVGGLVYAALAQPNLRRRVSNALLALGGVAAGGALSALPYLYTLQQAGYQPFDIAATRLWSASPLDYLVPSRLHPLWGPWFQAHYTSLSWIEGTLYLGVISGSLALLGFLRGSTLLGQRRWALLGLALIGFVFSLGTDLHLGGAPVRVEDPFWLPVYYLSRLPLMNIPRVWARFGVLPLWACAMFSGVGAAHLARVIPRGKLLAWLCLGLILVDLAPGRLNEVTALQLRPVDRWLAAQDGDFAVAFLPAGIENYAAMFGSLTHGKRLQAYNHPDHRPRAFEGFQELAGKFPRENAIRELCNEGFRYLVIHQPSYSQGGEQAWGEVVTALSQAGMQATARLGDYRVAPCP